MSSSLPHLSGRGRQCSVVTVIMAALGIPSILSLLYLWTAGFPAHVFGTPAIHSPSMSLDDYQVAAPYVFDSAQGLLKQWDNSEMSIGIYGGFGESKLHVYGTTRTLNILYFDGQAATLSTGGTLDSQMAVLQGRVPLYPSYDLVYDDDQRAECLCSLVDDLGIDGVVRMNAGFEVLICDYTAAQVQELFITNTTVPGNFEENPPSLPQDPNRQLPLGFGNVFSEQGSYEWLRSATWHYGHGGPSEERVKLDLCRMVSFYDPSLASLVDLHHGGIVGNQTFQNGWGLRRGHRLLDINNTDVETIRAWLREITSSTLGCSGFNWQALFTVIQAQHGTRAKELAAALKWKHDTQDEAGAVIAKVHELSHTILATYLEYQVSNPDSSVTSKDQTISRCTSVYTSLLNPAKLARAEVLFYHSVNTVMEKLCTWEWTLFEWSEKRTTDLLGQEGKPAELNALSKEIIEHRKLTEEVLAWIGWDTWSQCGHEWASNELCAVPTWPVVYAPGLPQGGIYAGNNPRLTEDETAEFWRPKCINRTDFDRGGGRGRDPIHQFPDVPPY
ncbi:hypothetical protein AK830_g8893 [Neonectria ditissima]|uniref:Uncharacterized protein n=1 Tax=Neonectria ditissima TaxID=78410 RepID=A0A0P7AW79_9HYPO|nr:hypothetical protein AK830_g8893 [Neonectria ditissima]